MNCSISQAQRIVESLRKGIPPDGFVREFTVGRDNEINRLKEYLKSKDGTSLLLNANYGAGKTHLIRFIREQALDENYAVSVVTLDAKNGIRFNRMDQILGMVCRNIEIPVNVKENDTSKGIKCFFNLIRRKLMICRIQQIKTANKNYSFWEKLSSDWKWNYSDILTSKALYVAIRAWYFGDAFSDGKIYDQIEDWLVNSDAWKTRKKELYNILVANFQRYFSDSRHKSLLYTDKVFSFNDSNYRQCWEALQDFNNLAKECGLNGLIILFDEFEDILTNITNINHQAQAFWNLFEFYLGKKFNGKTFYAVTPEFVKKCMLRLIQKGRFDYDSLMFKMLPCFEMSPLRTNDLVEMVVKIMQVHGIAYNWSPPGHGDSENDLYQIIKSSDIPVQDRTRHIIKQLVSILDHLLQENE